MERTSADPSLLGSVRSACAEVAGEAEFVHIAVDRLTDYADFVWREGGGGYEIDPGCHWLGEGEETVAFFLTLDAVNFGSGFFPLILSDPRQSGYRFLAAALTRHFRENGPLVAEKLASIREVECAAIFELDINYFPTRRLMELFARSWRDLGRFLLDNFAGSFSELVRAAGHSAERLVALLTLMPLYRDIAQYRGRPVPFFKRAQITAADLHIAFDGKGWGAFEDLDRLTLFADNLVPHVLRHDGVLTYQKELARRIDRGDPLIAGSPEEVEVRAVAVHVTELLVRELRRRGKDANDLWVDNRLWHRGQKPEFRSLPRHRTETPFY